MSKDDTRFIVSTALIVAIVLLLLGYLRSTIPASENMPMYRWAGKYSYYGDKTTDRAGKSKTNGCPLYENSGWPEITFTLIEGTCRTELVK